MWWVVIGVGRACGTPKKLDHFFFLILLGHYNHDEGDFSHISGSLYPIFLTKWDPLLVADMNLKLVPNTNYCSTDGFPQDIIACS